jgi:hypothetical protein
MMIFSVVMFVLWLTLGIGTLVTGHEYPWWWQVMMIFLMAADNLSGAIREALNPR